MPLTDDFVPLHRSGSYRSRPEMTQLRSWWERGAQGVCALIGGFGAGKSLLVDQFWLTGPTPKRPTFGRSFEEELSADTCCFELYEWVTGAPDRKPTPRGLVAALRRAPPVLIVLDAVENVLSPHGRLVWADEETWTGMLDRLLAEAVRGAFPNVGWILTSRFPPEHAVRTSLERYEDDPPAGGHPLERGRGPFYEPVRVGRLPTATCVELLRDGCQIVGNDQELIDIAVRCDGHPQMLRWVAAYLRSFENGRASRLPAWTPDEEINPGEGGHTEVGQGYGRWTEKVRTALAGLRQQLFAREPAALALLERLALYLRPWTAGDLAAAFLGSDKYPVAGKFLSRLDAAGLARALERLEAFGLAERADPVAGLPTWAAPAVVRELLPPMIPEATRAAIHAAIARAMRGRLNTVSVLDGGPSLWVPPGYDRRVARRTYFFDALASGVTAAAAANHDAALELTYHLIRQGEHRQAHDWILRWVNLSRPFYLPFSHVQKATSLFFHPKNPIEGALPLGLSTVEAATMLSSWADSTAALGDADLGIQADERCVALLEHSADAESNAILIYSANQIIGCDVFRGRLRQALSRLESLIERYTLPPPNRPNPVLSDLADPFRLVRMIIGQASLAERRAGGAPPLSTAQLRKFRTPEARYARRFGLTPMVRADWLHARDSEIELDGNDASKRGELFNIANLDRVVCAAEAYEPLRRQVAALGAYSPPPLILHTQLRWAQANFTLLSHANALGASDGGSALRAFRTQYHIEASADFKTALETIIPQLLAKARAYGASVYHTDALLLRAKLHLLAGRPRNARRDALTALYGLYPTPADKDPFQDAAPREEADPAEGRVIRPDEPGGRPFLYAATHPASGDVWGELEHRQVLAEADLLEAAQRLGAPTFRWETIPSAVRRLAESARCQLDHLIGRYQELASRLAPQSDPEYAYPELATARRLAAELRSGRLPPAPAEDPAETPPFDDGDLAVYWRLAREAADSPKQLLAFRSWLEVVALSRVNNHPRWREAFGREPPAEPFHDEPKKKKQGLSGVYLLVRELAERDSGRPAAGGRSVYTRCDRLDDLNELTPDTWIDYRRVVHRRVEALRQRLQGTEE